MRVGSISRLLLALTLGCAVGVACDDESVAGPSSQEAAPSIATLIPVSGPVGTVVTINGSGFASENNTVKFGSGYIRSLRSSDGGSLQFTIPEGLDLCAPDNTGPCQGGFPRVGPGEYAVAVMIKGAKSQNVTFTVTN